MISLAGKLLKSVNKIQNRKLNENMFEKIDPQELYRKFGLNPEGSEQYVFTRMIKLQDKMNEIQEFNLDMLIDYDPGNDGTLYAQLCTKDRSRTLDAWIKAISNPNDAMIEATKVLVKIARLEGGFKDELYKAFDETGFEWIYLTY